MSTKSISAKDANLHIATLARKNGGSIMHRFNVSDPFEKPNSLIDQTIHHRHHTPQQRDNVQRRAFRQKSMQFWQNYPLAVQQSNGDETTYDDLRGNYSKGLPHDKYGLVDREIYEKLKQALVTHPKSNIALLPPTVQSFVKRHFFHPLAGLTSEFSAPDPTHFAMPSAPTFDSLGNVAEIVECYWMAQLRDVYFVDYPESAMVHEAIDDFEQSLSQNVKLRESLLVRDFDPASQSLTTDTFFRGTFVGESLGPYLSQFLLQDCYLGSQKTEQRISTRTTGRDYLTSFGKWLEAQQGLPRPNESLDPKPRFIRNGRDLAEWVYNSEILQSAKLACAHLLASGAMINPSNPYRNASNAAGFANIVGPRIASMLMDVAWQVFNAVWYQKWVVHRRLRPDAFAGRIHLKYLGEGNGETMGFDIDPHIQETQAIARLYRKNGSLLLPMAFPGGSPPHPAYGSGRAAAAGACATILKAWFDGNQTFQTLCHAKSGSPLSLLQASADGRVCMPYRAADASALTIEGELNKLAGNIAMAGTFAGIHWRSDARESLLLGEKVAIANLMNYAELVNEPSVCFQFRSFTGHWVEIGHRQVRVDGIATIRQARSFSAELSVLETA